MVGKGMAKANGHYSGWVKRDEVKRGFTGPLGVTTTPSGFQVVKFAKPARINAAGLQKALDQGVKAKAAS